MPRRLALRYTGLVMAQPARDLFAAALALPEEERLHLASELIASVEDPHDAEWEAAWLEELERREQAVRTGGAQGSDWSEVRARVVARLSSR
jgi:putative addiction module component (TIGR02574 family)